MQLCALETHTRISRTPGTSVQYFGPQGRGALGDAPKPGTTAGSVVVSAHGGTYSHAAVTGGTWGEKDGAASSTAAAAPRRCRATPTGRAVTPPPYGKNRSDNRHFLKETGILDSLGLFCVSRFRGTRCGSTVVLTVIVSLTHHFADSKQDQM